MVAETIYSDWLATITGESILFKCYDIFELDKLLFPSILKKSSSKSLPFGMVNSAFMEREISISGFPGISRDTNATRFSSCIFAINGGVLDLPSKTQPLL